MRSHPAKKRWWLGPGLWQLQQREMFGSTHILKVDGIGLHGSLHMEYERKRGNKFDAEIFGLSNCKEL